MRKKFFVVTVGCLFAVFTFTDASARRLNLSFPEAANSVSLSETTQRTSGIEAIALSLLLLAISVNILQKFFPRRKSPTTMPSIVDQVEKLQNGIVRRILSVPTK